VVTRSTALIAVCFSKIFGRAIRNIHQQRSAVSTIDQAQLCLKATELFVLNIATAVIVNSKVFM
jgi:hypothetical protein